MATVKRKGKLKGKAAKVENGLKRGLILAGDLVAQRAANRAHRVTDRLKRSIARNNPRKGRGKYTYSIKIGSNLKYAEIEEFRAGTKDGTSHAYLRPTLQESRDEVKQLLIKSIMGALTGQ